MTAPWHMTATEMDAEWNALRSRLAEAELSRDSWKREAELNQQAADESAGYARRLAEAEALLMELNQRPRHFEGGVYWLRTYTGDYERIARIVAPDSASGEGEK